MNDLKLPVLLLSLAVGAVPLRAAETPERPAAEFQEVYELLKQHLATATPADLDRAAVRGLLEQLGGRVTLLGDPAADAGTNRLRVEAASVFEKHYAYVRLGRIAAGVENDFADAWKQLGSSNQLKGLALDLRFASGEDYAAAVALADRFFATERPLADWGDGPRQAAGRTDALTLPVAVLVNRRTAGAAEALAAMLRFGDAALLLGTNTAGQAGIAKEFTLKNGARLRVAVAPIKIAGDKIVPFTGLVPDIPVAVAPKEEKLYLANAFRAPTGAVTEATNDPALASSNRAPRRPRNEADLVRMMREGQNPALERTNPAPPPPEPPPQVRDPALARALDLLKGLAVVQQFRGL
jgi:hypothetical protein